MNKLFSIILIMLYSTGFCEQPNRLLFLQNDQIKVGILPEVGGRIVFFGTLNGENCIHSDSTLWNEPISNRITPTVDTDFKAYNGNITWVGPQSEWWNQQTVNAGKKDAVWPPDPFLEYAAYTIISKTDTSIVVSGAESIICGLQLTKSYTLKGNQLEIKVTARNCRTTSVSWDLWSNTRFNAFSRFKVPVADDGIMRIEKVENNHRGSVPHQLKDGFFTFLPVQTIGIINISKAFIYPTEGCFYIQKPDGLMTIKFDLVDKKEIHPEQAMVEVYSCISPNGETDILELEHHAAYKTLQPNQTMEMRETWIIDRN